MIVLAKRLVISSILVFLQDFPYTQIIVLTVLNVGFLLALINQRPYANKTEAWTNYIQEGFFLLIHSMIIAICYDNHHPGFSEQKRLDIGWVIIGSCLAIIMVAILIIVAMMLKSFKDLVLNCTNLCKKAPKK